MTRSPSRWLDTRFQISAHGSTVPRVVVAGVTTFLAMAYIIVVNPAILSEAGMDFGAVFLSGVAFLAPKVLPVREWLVNAIPRNLKLGMAAGIGIGFIAYALIKVAAGRWRECPGVVYLVALIFALKFAFL